jgi:RHS repeat-associated protein
MSDSHPETGEVVATNPVTNSTGALVKTYRYEPYGKIESQTGTASDPVHFAGGYEGAGGLLHFGERDCDPTLGRWTQPDPLDQTGDLTDGNPYIYVGDDPVNYVDPRGQCPVCVVPIAIGAEEVVTAGVALAGAQIAASNEESEPSDPPDPFAGGHSIGSAAVTLAKKSRGGESSNPRAHTGKKRRSRHSHVPETKQRKHSSWKGNDDKRKK